MARRTRSERTPEDILAAASQIVLRSGLHALTIDAVAAEVGISKGGVLHHFRTKDALIAGVVDAAVLGLETTLKQKQDAGASRFVDALLDYAKDLYSDNQQAPRALLIAATENSAANQRINSVLHGVIERTRDAGGNDGKRDVIFYAVMGILVSRALDLLPASAGDEAALIAQLRTLAE